MESKKRDNKHWSEKPVVMDFMFLRVILFLRVVLKEGKPIYYCIEVGFHDAENDSMEQWDCSITVDLSEYSNELE